MDEAANKYPRTYESDHIPSSVRGLIRDVLPRLLEGEHPALVALREQCLSQRSRVLCRTARSSGRAPRVSAAHRGRQRRDHVVRRGARCRLRSLRRARATVDVGGLHVRRRTVVRGRRGTFRWARDAATASPSLVGPRRGRSRGYRDRGLEFHPRAWTVCREPASSSVVRTKPLSAKATPPTTR